MSRLLREIDARVGYPPQSRIARERFAPLLEIGSETVEIRNSIGHNYRTRISMSLHSEGYWSSSPNSPSGDRFDTAMRNIRDQLREYIYGEQRDLILKLERRVLDLGLGPDDERPLMDCIEELRELVFGYAK